MKFCVTHIECGGPEFTEAGTPEEAIDLVNPLMRYSKGETPDVDQWKDMPGRQVRLSLGGADWIDGSKDRTDYPARKGPVFEATTEDSHDYYYIYEVE